MTQNCVFQQFQFLLNLGMIIECLHSFTNELFHLFEIEKFNLNDFIMIYNFSKPGLYSHINDSDIEHH